MTANETPLVINKHIDTGGLNMAYSSKGCLKHTVNGSLSLERLQKHMAAMFNGLNFKVFD